LNGEAKDESATMTMVVGVAPLSGVLLDDDMPFEIIIIGKLHPSVPFDTYVPTPAEVKLLLRELLSRQVVTLDPDSVIDDASVESSHITRLALKKLDPVTG
jgi:hypothetical protein